MPTLVLYWFDYSNCCSSRDDLSTWQRQALFFFTEYALHFSLYKVAIYTDTANFRFLDWLCVNSHWFLEFKGFFFPEQQLLMLVFSHPKLALPASHTFRWWLKTYLKNWKQEAVCFSVFQTFDFVSINMCSSVCRQSVQCEFPMICFDNSSSFFAASLQNWSLTLIEGVEMWESPNSQTAAVFFPFSSLHVPLYLRAAMTDGKPRASPPITVPRGRCAVTEEGW